MPLKTEVDGRRLALLVATASYNDRTLQQLRSPGQDAQQLENVLADPAIGGFDVVPLIDTPKDRVERTIAEFCRNAAPRDLILLYLSCHGVLDDRGRLYYATVNTEREWLSATAIRADWLNEQLEDSPARSQIVILDCCHSGAFAKGTKGDSALALEGRFEGRGRILLTASRATEYSFEGDRPIGVGATSVFTSALVDGLTSGEADVDKDGLVTVSNLYDYVHKTVRRGENRQTPGLWTYGAEGTLVVARSPRGAIVRPTALPENLRQALENPAPRVREGAVQELGDVLIAGDAAAAMRARLTLEEVAERDIPVIAQAARNALARVPDATTGKSSDALAGVGREAERPVATHPEPTRDVWGLPDGVAKSFDPSAGWRREAVRVGTTRTRPKRDVWRYPWVVAMAYVVATLGGAAVGSLIASQVVAGGIRLEVAAFLALSNGLPMAGWLAVMKLVRQGRVPGAVIVGLLIVATVLSALPALVVSATWAARVVIIVFNSVFGAAFGLLIGAVSRSRRVGVVATATAVGGAIIGSLAIPLSWDNSTGGAVAANVVVTLVAIAGTVIYLTFRKGETTHAGPAGDESQDTAVKVVGQERA